MDPIAAAKLDMAIQADTASMSQAQALFARKTRTVPMTRFAPVTDIVIEAVHALPQLQVDCSESEHILSELDTMTVTIGKPYRWLRW